MTNTALPYGIVAAAITVLLEKQGPQTRADVERKLPQYRHAHRVLARMHDQGDVHIEAWQRGEHGQQRSYMRPIYAAGPGVDAKRPKPQTKAEASRVYRAKQKRIELQNIFHQMVSAPPAP